MQKMHNHASPAPFPGCATLSNFINDLRTNLKHLDPDQPEVVIFLRNCGNNLTGHAKRISAKGLPTGHGSVADIVAFQQQ
ncbi:MAG: hypothetical protein FWD68_07375 [Alphaproteobacteria bacterium]|nr:hypothetical protein [Alphaproteobacteria bacterium]